jgi:phospholipid/cholesterol/gamma-HCH transport system substrate-binding protein
MLTRLIKAQIVAFAVITVLAVTYCALVYVKLPEKLGIGRHTLTVELPDTGELYPEALVTLRGIPVGEVTDIDLTDTGAAATLSVDDAAVIPRGSQVTVRSASAIGEQYLNFDPAGLVGPAWSPGDVVPVTQVLLPTPDNDLLRDANALLASLPKKDLGTAVKELGDAFGGRATDLRWLLNSSGALLDTATANIGPTRRLIGDLGPVLHTQRDLSPRLRSITGNLAIVTDQLRRSDPDLRGTLEKTGPALGALDGLVHRLQPTLPLLLSDLTSVGQVLQVYLPNVRQTLVVLPTTINDLQSSVYNTPIPGAAKLSFKTLLNDPPPCTTGFLGRHQREPNDFSPAPPAVNAYCREPSDSRIGPRMGRNDPCPNNPELRSRTASGCGLNFQSPTEASTARDEAVRTQLRVASTNPTSAPRPAWAPPPDPGGVGAGAPSPPARSSRYDQATGLFLAPDGQPFLLGGHTADSPRPGSPAATDWHTLLTDPMGMSR